MGRLFHKGHHAGAAAVLLFVAAVSGAGSCTGSLDEDTYAGRSVRSAKIRFGMADSGTKAIDPDETLISDINVFVFNSFGVLEDKVYLSGPPRADGYCWST